MGCSTLVLVNIVHLGLKVSSWSEIIIFSCICCILDFHVVSSILSLPSSQIFVEEFQNVLMILMMLFLFIYLILISWLCNTSVVILSLWQKCASTCDSHFSGLFLGKERHLKVVFSMCSFYFCLVGPEKLSWNLAKLYFIGGQEFVFICARDQKGASSITLLEDVTSSLLIWHRNLYFIDAALVIIILHLRYIDEYIYTNEYIVYSIFFSTKVYR